MLVQGIVVRIIHKELAGGKFYKQKAVVREVQDRYLGKVEVIDNKALIAIDQACVHVCLVTT